MSRVVRCSLIQARNVEPAEKSLADIKKAMIEKHVGMIRKAAGDGADRLPAGNFLRSLLLCRASHALV